MATLVQRTSGNGGGYVNSYTKAFASNVTVNNALFLAIACGDGDIPTISDNKGNAWTLRVSQTLASQRKVQIWQANNSIAGATTVTVAFQGGQFSDSAIIMWEESGLPIVSAYDVSASSTTSAGTSYASGNTATLAQSSEYVVAALAVDIASPTITGDASYGSVVSQAGSDLYTSVHIQDKSVASTAAQSATMTSSVAQNGSIAVATFKNLVVPPPPRMALMGFG